MNPYLVWLTLKRCWRGLAVVRNLITERELVRELPWSYVRHRVRRSPVILLQLIAIPAAGIVLPLGFLFSPVAILIPFALLAWFVAFAATMIRGAGRFVRDVRGK